MIIEAKFRTFSASVKLRRVWSKYLRQFYCQTYETQGLIILLRGVNRSSGRFDSGWQIRNKIRISGQSSGGLNSIGVARIFAAGEALFCCLIGNDLFSHRP